MEVLIYVVLLIAIGIYEINLLIKEKKDEKLISQIEKEIGHPVFIGDSLEVEDWENKGRPLVLEELYRDNDIIVYADSGYGYLVLCEKVSGEWKVFYSMEGGVKGNLYSVFWDDSYSGVVIYKFYGMSSLS